MTLSRTSETRPHVRAEAATSWPRLPMSLPPAPGFFPLESLELFSEAPGLSCYGYKSEDEFPCQTRWGRPKLVHWLCPALAASPCNYFDPRMRCPQRGQRGRGVSSFFGLFGGKRLWGPLGNVRHFQKYNGCGRSPSNLPACWRYDRNTEFWVGSAIFKGSHLALLF